MFELIINYIGQNYILIISLVGLWLMLSISVSTTNDIAYIITKK